MVASVWQLLFVLLIYIYIIFCFCFTSSASVRFISVSIGGSGVHTRSLHKTGGFLITRFPLKLQTLRYVTKKKLKKRICDRTEMDAFRISFSFFLSVSVLWVQRIVLNDVLKTLSLCALCSVPYFTSCCSINITLFS